jgi:hypothetical protein
VVFVEPVFFCAADVVRLMQYPADLACGMQLAEPGRAGGAAAAAAAAAVPGAEPAPRNLLHNRALHRRRRLQQWQQQQQQQEARVLGSQGPVAKPATDTAAVLQSDVPPEFTVKAVHSVYDATGDVTGSLLSMHPPYLLHGASAYAAREGLPFPVYCCWGGLAKLRGAALAAGLRFRSALQGECSTTETSLLCDELMRAGFTRNVLDPGVPTSAQLHTKQLFEQQRFPPFTVPSGRHRFGLTCSLCCRCHTGVQLAAVQLGTAALVLLEVTADRVVSWVEAWLTAAAAAAVAIPAARCLWVMMLY